jgi:hypothetical protein
MHHTSLVLLPIFTSIAACSLSICMISCAEEEVETTKNAAEECGRLFHRSDHGTRVALQGAGHLRSFEL